MTCDLLRAARQHADVDADGGECRPELDAMLREGCVGAQDPGGLSAGLEAAHRILDSVNHLRVAGRSWMAEGTVNLMLLHVLSSVSARSGPRVFNGLDPSGES
jgi:hypothetical protein